MSLESEQGSWYIVKQPSERCEIVLGEALESVAAQRLETWGPFETKNQAIAKRVGLIRAGKCQPS